MKQAHLVSPELVHSVWWLINRDITQQEEVSAKGAYKKNDQTLGQDTPYLP